MTKLISKLYKPKDLLDVIKAVEKIYYYDMEAKDLVIELRKIGYKIVKVDDGK